MRPVPYLALAALLTGCSPDLDAPRMHVELPLRMSEVVRVNGYTISLSQFEELRVRFPSIVKDDRVWLVSAAAALFSRKEEMAPWVSREDTEPDCLRLALYARGLLSPGESEPLIAQLAKRLGNPPDARALKARIDEVLSRSKLEKNAELLSQIQ